MCINQSQKNVQCFQMVLALFCLFDFVFFGFYWLGEGGGGGFVSCSTFFDSVHVLCCR